jgi:hypothetical protein
VPDAKADSTAPTSEEAFERLAQEATDALKDYDAEEVV